MFLLKDEEWSAVTPSVCLYESPCSCVWCARCFSTPKPGGSVFVRVSYWRGGWMCVCRPVSGVCVCMLARQLLVLTSQLCPEQTRGRPDTRCWGQRWLEMSCRIRLWTLDSKPLLTASNPPSGGPRRGLALLWKRRGIPLPLWLHLRSFETCRGEKMKHNLK